MTPDSVRRIVGFEDDSSLRCAPAALISGRYRISSVTWPSRTPGPSLQDPRCRIPRAQDAVGCVAKCARLRALCQLFSETIWLNANSSLRRRQMYNVRRATMQGQVRGIEVRRPCSPLTIHPRYSRFPPPRIPRTPERSLPRTRCTTPHDTRRTIALPPLVPLPYLILRPIPPSFHPSTPGSVIRASPSHVSRHPPTLA